MAQEIYSNFNWVCSLKFKGETAFTDIKAAAITLTQEQDENQYGLHGSLYKYNQLGQIQLSGTIEIIYNEKDSGHKKLYQKIVAATNNADRDEVTFKFTLLKANLQASSKTIQFDGTLKPDGDIIGDISSGFKLTFGFMSNGTPTFS